MLTNKFLILLSLSILLLVLLLTPADQSWAGEENNLDEVISGFDDEKEDSLQDIVDGFEEDEKEKDSNDFDDTILDGFDDDQNLEGGSQAISDEESFVIVNGHIKLGSTVNISHDSPRQGETDWRGLSRFRPELQLELTKNLSNFWKIFISGKAFYDAAYEIKGREKFNDNLICAYEKDSELLEAYAQGRITDSLDIKTGRQIVVWGKSDNIRITDVLNPMDIREPGVTDIEDLRLPVFMTRLDYYTGAWNITGLVTHEIRFNKTPEYGSDFYPAPLPLPHESIPADGGKNSEYAAALNGIFSGWDISFYWADIFNDTPHAEIVASGFPLRMERKHANLKMLGTAVNAVFGNWLLKSEAAYLDGFKFLNSDTKTYSRTDLLGGIEYAGFKDITVSLEIANRHINQFESNLQMPPDYAVRNEFQSVFRMTSKHFNDTLDLAFLTSVYGVTGQDGSFQRISAEYDLTDAVEISGGIVIYQSGDRFMYSRIGDNDRIFLEIKYSF